MSQAVYSAEMADDSDLFLSELRETVLFAASLATFGVSVPHVVRGSPEEQMVHVDARRVIAVMADKKTIRDRSVDKFPGEAVNSYAARISSASSYRSMPGSAAAADPENATRRRVFNGMSAESFFQRRVRMSGHADLPEGRGVEPVRR
jgi:hypothetical protein